MKRLLIGLVLGTVLSAMAFYIPGYVTQSSTWLTDSLIDNTPIGTTTPAVGIFTNITGTLTGNATTATTLQNNALQYGQSSGCSTGSGGGSVCGSTVPWVIGYSDTGYYAVCTIVNPFGYPSIQGYTKTNSSITVNIQNGTSNQAVNSGGVLNCIALHP